MDIVQVIFYAFNEKFCVRFLTRGVILIVIGYLMFCFLVDFVKKKIRSVVIGEAIL